MILNFFFNKFKILITNIHTLFIAKIMVQIITAIIVVRWFNLVWPSDWSTRKRLAAGWLTDWPPITILNLPYFFRFGFFYKKKTRNHRLRCYNQNQLNYHAIFFYLFVCLILKLKIKKKNNTEKTMFQFQWKCQNCQNFFSQRIVPCVCS